MTSAKLRANFRPRLCLGQGKFVKAEGEYKATTRGRREKRYETSALRDRMRCCEEEKVEMGETTLDAKLVFLVDGWIPDFIKITVVVPNPTDVFAGPIRRILRSFRAIL